jgi:hypothetical protein
MDNIIKWSETTGSLFKALAQAQGDMGSAVKDGTNPHFKSRYATLASVLQAVLPALNKHGLSLSQHPSLSEGMVQVTTLLTHSSGQWMSSTCELPLQGRKDGHALKSATTYLRRTACVSICGLPEEDDDGNLSTARPRSQGRTQPRRQERRPEPPRQPAPQLTIEQVASALESVDLTIADMDRWAASHNRKPIHQLDQQTKAAMVRWVTGGGADVVRQWFQQQADEQEDVIVPVVGGEG